MGLSKKPINSISTHVQTIAMTLIILFCTKLLCIMYTTNKEILSARPTVFHFVAQGVYKAAPLPLAPKEDCSNKSTTIPEYRHRIANHISDQCRKSYGGKDVSNQLHLLPEVCVNSIILDKQRNFMYTAVKGAFGNRWSKFMVEVNKKDGGKDNLVKVAYFFQTGDGKDYLDHSNLFKFYFVRNPLDRVISGYYYFFHDMKYATKYLNGKALRELIAVNGLNPRNVKAITFQQYIRWIIYGPSAGVHFGVQYDIIQPCIIDYTLNGIFEILKMQRLIVGNHVLDLKTPKSSFTTERDVTYLTKEANTLLEGVEPEIMNKFYSKYSLDYTMWNYSKPDDWWYPYPALIKNMRIPNPKMQNNDFPKIKDIKDEEALNDIGNQLFENHHKKSTNWFRDDVLTHIIHLAVIFLILLPFLLLHYLTP